MSRLVTIGRNTQSLPWHRMRNCAAYYAWVRVQHLASSLAWCSTLCWPTVSMGGTGGIGKPALGLFVTYNVNFQWLLTDSFAFFTFFKCCDAVVEGSERARSIASKLLQAAVVGSLLTAVEVDSWWQSTKNKASLRASPGIVFDVLMMQCRRAQKSSWNCVFVFRFFSFMYFVSFEQTSFINIFVRLLLVSLKLCYPSNLLKNLALRSKQLTITAKAHYKISRSL